LVRPQITLHFAQSLDGRIGYGPGHERAILSSQEGIAHAHRARSSHDAVLIGVETLLCDNPQLTARGVGAAHPLRIVLDSTLRSPATSRLFAQGPEAGRAIVVGTLDHGRVEQRARLEALGAEVWLVAPDGEGRVDLHETLERLATRGVERLLVEGGARVLTSFLRTRLADRAQIELAPLFLGAPATSCLAELGLGQVGAAPRLEQLDVERLGSSLVLSGTLSYPEGGVQ
jgi:5-amino-6-(5-phosphoribosylamino)uracil reductase/diaminohydroxyphosphoribosylaminopyrimidine deaminase/5-amino-6-(5-phosphoribosylamino)uracil reductase